MLGSLLRLEARLHEIAEARAGDTNLRRRLNGALRILEEAHKEHHAEAARWAGIAATLAESGLPARLLNALERALAREVVAPRQTEIDWRINQH